MRFLPVARGASAALAAWLLGSASIAQSSNPPLLKLSPLDRLPDPVVAPASTEGQNAIARTQLPPQFDIHLYAAEPMLANPVAFAFDEKGVLYVAETERYGSSVLDIRNYMPMLEEDLAARTVADRSKLILHQFGEVGKQQLSIESDLVRRIVDTDGDGVADRSSIFAAGFNDPLDGIASGVLARDGKVYFTNIPHLWLLDGPDAQGRSTGRKSLSYGYGIRYGYTGHDLHGLIMGPDGKLYFSIGDRGADARATDGSRVSTPDFGAVFRCNPDGTELEAVHTGLRNPQELAFDDFGNLFTGDNDCDQGDRERFVAVVEGGNSGWRVGYQHSPLGKAGPWNSEKLWYPFFPGQAAYLLPPIVNTADGPSGLTHYPGTGLPAEFADSFFMCHFKGSFTTSGIYRYRVQPDGAFFKMVVQEPFITGILPTDVDFGPDSRLYFSDWGQGWPKSKKGRMYAVTHQIAGRDPAVAATRTLLSEGMKHRPVAELVTLLGHGDQRIRLEAQYALALRGASAVSALTAAARSEANRLARIHAVWGLGQIARRTPSALAPLRALLADADSEVRAQAAKVLGDARDAAAFAGLVTGLSDAESRVRFFSALSLGKLQRAEATAPLLAMLRANDDRDLYLRHAGVMGLAGSRNVAALTTAISDPSRAVRMAVLLALRRLEQRDIARFLNDSDPLLVVEAARAINDVPILAAQPALASLSETAAEGPDEALVLRVLNARFRNGSAEDARMLVAYASHAATPEKYRVEALVHLRNWARPPARDRIVGVYRPLPARDASVAARALAEGYARILEAAPAAVALATIQALDELGVRAAGDTLSTMVTDETLPAKVRAAALKPLAAWAHPNFAQTLRIAGLATAPQLRAAAQPYLATLSPAEALPILKHALEAGTQLEKQTAIGTLVALPGAEVDTLLADYLRRLGHDPALQPLEVELLDAAEKRATPELKALLAQRTAALQSAPTIEKFSFALKGGDRLKGRNLFYDHPVLACVRCHKIRDEGGEAGPALDLIGRNHTRDYILESIVTPNAAIAAGFDSVALTLTDGSLQVGSIAAEDADSLSLRPPTGEGVVKIAKSKIAKRESAPSSMPEIFALILSRAELRDLVEFVSSLGTSTDKTQPKE